MSDLDNLADDDFVTMDGYDDCIIGVCYHFSNRPVVAYSLQKIVEKLQIEGEMTEEEAIEFFEYNQLGAWVGEGTPVFIDTAGMDEMLGSGRSVN